MYTFVTVLMYFYVDFSLNILKCTAGCISHCITIHAGALNWSVILMRPVLYFRIPPTVGVQEAKSATVGSQTQNVLQYVSFTALNSEEKLHWTQPGNLRAATQWTHTATATATATPLHLTHMNVTTNVNGMSLYDFYVKYLHFDYMLAKSITVKSYITKKNPQNCIFLVEC